jgi:hypothetical protein
MRGFRVLVMLHLKQYAVMSNSVPHPNPRTAYKSLGPVTFSCIVIFYQFFSDFNHAVTVNDRPSSNQLSLYLLLYVLAPVYKPKLDFQLAT